MKLFPKHYIQSDETLESFKDDLRIQCTGYKFEAGFLKENFSECLSDKNKIYVNDRMQISREDRE